MEGIASRIQLLAYSLLVFIQWNIVYRMIGMDERREIHENCAASVGDQNFDLESPRGGAPRH